MPKQINNARPTRPQAEALLIQCTSSQTTAKAKGNLEPVATKATNNPQVTARCRFANTDVINANTSKTANTPGFSGLPSRIDHSGKFPFNPITMADKPAR